MTAWRNTAGGYGWPALVLHWGMFLLVALAYITMEWRGYVPKGDPLRDTLINLHRSFGMLVFALLAVRLALRATETQPAIRPPLPAWQEWGSRAIHYTLYAMLAILPVTGYLVSNSAGRTVTFFGLALPRVIGADEALHDTFEEVHDVVANFGYALIGVHAAAALWHHYVRRDDTLRRMLPSGG